MNDATLGMFCLKSDIGYGLITEHVWHVLLYFFLLFHRVLFYVELPNKTARGQEAENNTVQSVTISHY